MDNRPRMCVLATTSLAIHFFLKPHLSALSDHFEVTLVCNFQSDRYLPPLALPVIEKDLAIERRISPFRDLLALFRLFSLIRGGRFDVVFSVVPKAGLLGMLVAWSLRIPFRVHVFQGEVWAARNGPMRWLLRFMDSVTARLATHVLVVSPSEKQFLEREGVVPKGKAQLLGEGSICGVDIERFRPGAYSKIYVREEFRIPQEAVVCVFLGRLTRDKGVLELARAFAISAAEKKDFWLLLAGPDEEMVKDCLYEVVPEALRSRLRYLGFVQKPEKVLAAADFLCLPSHREGLGMVILEAAAMGIPSIGTRIHGITDAIEDGKTGLLIQVGDVAGIAKAMIRWCESPEERNFFAAAAQKRVISKFEQQSVVDRYVDFFCNLILDRY